MCPRGDQVKFKDLVLRTKIPTSVTCEPVTVRETLAGGILRGPRNRSLKTVNLVRVLGGNHLRNIV